jgi:hypothetical protein
MIFRLKSFDDDSMNDEYLANFTILQLILFISLSDKFNNLNGTADFNQVF